MRIKYFAINVASNKFRRDRVREQCARFGIPVEIFTAVTPATLSNVPNNYNAKRTSRHWGRPLMETELACGLSHISLWRQLIATDDADAFVVIEDDVTITADLPTILEKINFDKINFLKLSGQHKRPERDLGNIHENHHLVKMAYGPLDTGAYLLTKVGAQQLEKYCQTMHMSIDVMMDRSYSHGVPVYAIKPYPVECLQNDDPNSPLGSDIGPRRNKYFDDKSITEKYISRLYRSTSSIKKRSAEIKLKLLG